MGKHKFWANETILVGGWTNPSEKYATVKLGIISPSFRGENKKCLNCHHLAIVARVVDLARFIKPPGPLVSHIFRSSLVPSNWRIVSEHVFTGWWLNQPIWNIWSSNWIISPGIGVEVRNVSNHHLDFSHGNPPGNAHSQLWKESLYSLLVKVAWGVFQRCVETTLEFHILIYNCYQLCPSKITPWQSRMQCQKTHSNVFCDNVSLYQGLPEDVPVAKYLLWWNFSTSSFLDPSFDLSYPTKISQGNFQVPQKMVPLSHKAPIGFP